MKGWEIFWATVVIFSTVSFTYLSVKILIKGWPELKVMFKALDDQKRIRDAAQKSQ